MSDKIDGISFWDDIQGDAIYENRGWAVNDAGEDEAQEGYTLVFDYKTKKGKEKSFYVSFTERSILDMLAKVREAWAP